MNIILYILFGVVLVAEILQIGIYTNLALTEIDKQKKPDYWLIVFIHLVATAFLSYMFITNI